MAKNLLVSSILFFINILLVSVCWAKTGEILHFSGYDWEIKDGKDDPGNNYWSADNVWVDQDGCLHLKITWDGSKWCCAELMSAESFAYGKYQFQVIGELEQFDPNLVLGLFVYPAPESQQAEPEIDIEFAKWGVWEGQSGNYTVPTRETFSFPVVLNGNYTTHQFTWRQEQILFESFHGHVAQAAAEFQQWLYKTEKYDQLLMIPLVRVHMNLWLFKGRAPLNGVEQEIIIRKFTFSA